MTFVPHERRVDPTVTRGRKGSEVAPADSHLIAAPLTSGSHPNSNAPGRRKEDDENLIAFHPTQDPISGPISHALSSEESGAVAIASSASVRRLSPKECERLQSFPDDWTAPDEMGGPADYVERKGKWRPVRGSGVADDKRYAALGDAVTVNVAEWLGRRIAGRVVV